MPEIDLKTARRLNCFLVEAASRRILKSAHDCAEGGLAVALAECSIAGGLGLSAKYQAEISPAAAFFGESQNRVLISLNQDKLGELEKLAAEYSLPLSKLGQVGGEIFSLTFNGPKIEMPLKELDDIYRNSLADMVRLSTSPQPEPDESY